MTTTLYAVAVRVFHQNKTGAIHDVSHVTLVVDADFGRINAEAARIRQSFAQHGAIGDVYIVAA